MDSWVDEIVALKPGYIAFSITTFVTLLTVRYMVKKLKERAGQILIIFGGPPCKDYKDKMIREYGADISILESGENALVAVLNALQNKSTLSDIKGIIYREGQDIIINQENEDLGDLDTLPFPDYDDFDLTQYLEKNPLSNRCTLILQGSKGCTRSCTFCTYKFYMGSFSSRSAERVFKEMAYLKQRYGVISFEFVDAMVNADIAFLEDLCDKIIASRQTFVWIAKFGIKEDNPPSLAQKLAKAGCIGVIIGLESGSEEIRRQMLKSCSDASVKKQLHDLHRSGIFCNINIIVGYPTETEEHFNQTIEMLKDIHPYIGDLNLFICSIVPGTILSLQAKRDGNFILDENRSTNWSYKENTLQERIHRKDRLVKMAKEIGLDFNVINSI